MLSISRMSLAAALLAAAGVAAFAQAPQSQQPAEAKVQSEAVEVIDTVPCPPSHSLLDPGATPLMYQIWLGPSYASIAAGDSGWGFAYGGALGYTLGGGWQLYGSIGLNHALGSTDVAGTIGIQHFPTAPGAPGLGSTTLAVYWDQFTNTDQDEYLHSIRLQAGYAISPSLEVGVTGAISTSGGQDVPQVTPITSVMGVFPGESGAGGYARYMTGPWSLQSVIGWLNATDSAIFGFSARRALTANCGFNIHIATGEDVDFTSLLAFDVRTGGFRTEGHQ